LEGSSYEVVTEELKDEKDFMHDSCLFAYDALVLEEEDM